MKSFDVIILGAGAAGLMCAFQVGLRGRRVLLLDHAHKLAEKIRISGGGHCNFTNLNVGPENYLSENPHFCRSALARFTAEDFIALLDKHGIDYHEKSLGRLFCNGKSDAMIRMLHGECEAAGVTRMMGCEIKSVARELPEAPGYLVICNRGRFRSRALVVATGGLSLPGIGASPLGYRLAEQFSLPVIKPRPGLVPLNFAAKQWEPYARLSGLSLPVVAGCGKQQFRENLLFTHRGLSGPAILQISSYWRQGQFLNIDLLPDTDLMVALRQHKSGTRLLGNFLARWLPKTFVEVWLGQKFSNKPLNQYNDNQYATLRASIHHWQLKPHGTQGYNKAEVTCGGVDTRALSSKTMEANQVPGLFFIGEVLDVTGHLGGYNFQWAWSSAYAAAQAV
uniref:Flavoprotein, HI0933 family n=1 Tax=Candidatus Kentrum sp. DK TaxID=2126562 RepID=A0A450TI40_9GAMM|nr:MAG: hypothetical protein BECKDK2373C_GA0170839_11561 [Candidatus Kentron sp. DK]